MCKKSKFVILARLMTSCCNSCPVDMCECELDFPSLLKKQKTAEVKHWFIHEATFFSLLFYFSFIKTHVPKGQ